MLQQLNGSGLLGVPAKLAIVFAASALVLLGQTCTPEPGCTTPTPPTGPPSPPTITTKSVPNGTVGVPYNFQFQASGGAGGPYTWTVVNGVLSVGLNLGSNTGVISGTPTVSGQSQFEITAADSTGSSDASSFVLTILSATTTTVSSSEPTAFIDQPFNIIATVKDATNPGTPVNGGSVTFTAGGLTLGTAPVSNGSATLSGFMPNNVGLTEGTYDIVATYSPLGNSFAASAGQVAERINNPPSTPTISGNTYSYCNNTPVEIPHTGAPGPAGTGAPYPSNIIVTNLLGTISKLEVTLNTQAGLTDLDDIASRLVGPTGISIDFFSNVGGGGTNSDAATYRIFDGAGVLGGQNFNSITPLPSGNYPPESYKTASGALGTFPLCQDPVTDCTGPMPVGPPAPITGINYAPPAGSATFASAFNGTDPNGTWSLYFATDAADDPVGTLGNWCIELTVSAAVPTVTSVVNNYSYIPDGFPNSGAAPSSILFVSGIGMAQSVPNLTLNSSAAPGIPTTSAGATFTLTDSSGATFHPGIYYATPIQAALVLPAVVKTGTATITVSYNGQTSNAFQFQVVPSALGLGTYYGTANGLITATNAETGALFGYTNSAEPGQTIVLWGTGLGSDPSDSDSVFTTTPHTVNQPSTQIYFGGVAGTVLYAGSSGYPGLNQINVTIPANVATGCWISVDGVVGTAISNFGTLPIQNGGGECGDATLGITGSLLSTLSAQPTVTLGSLLVGQSTTPSTNGSPQTNDFAQATLESVTGASFGASPLGFISIGSCTVSETTSSSSSSTATGIDAGPSITLTGPLGNIDTLPESSTKGTYKVALPPDAIPSTGGAFTFTGTGTGTVGPFNATLTFPTPILTWTNQTDAATIPRTKGVTVNWTGGPVGSLVTITGSSSANGVTGSFTCNAQQSALTFTVPSYVTGVLPAGTGTLAVTNETSYVPFTATGLDYGFGFGSTSTLVSTTYQ